LLSKGIKRGEAMIRRCSYHNSLPSHAKNLSPFNGERDKG